MRVHVSSSVAADSHRTGRLLQLVGFTSTETVGLLGTGAQGRSQGGGDSSVVRAPDS